LKFSFSFFLIYNNNHHQQKKEREVGLIENKKIEKKKDSYNLNWSEKVSNKNKDKN